VTRGGLWLHAAALQCLQSTKRRTQALNKGRFYLTRGGLWVHAAALWCVQSTKRRTQAFDSGHFYVTCGQLWLHTAALCFLMGTQKDWRGRGSSDAVLRCMQSWKNKTARHGQWICNIMLQPCASLWAYERIGRKEGHVMQCCAACKAESTKL